MGETINKVSSHWGMEEGWVCLSAFSYVWLSLVLLPLSDMEALCETQNAQGVRVLRRFNSAKYLTIAKYFVGGEKRNKGIGNCHIVNESQNSSWFWPLLGYLGTLDNLNKGDHSSHSQRPASLSQEPITARNNHAKIKLFLLPSSGCLPSQHKCTVCSWVFDVNC